MVTTPMMATMMTMMAAVITMTGSDDAAASAAVPLDATRLYDTNTNGIAVQMMTLSTNYCDDASETVVAAMQGMTALTMMALTLKTILAAPHPLSSGVERRPCG